MIKIPFLNKFMTEDQEFYDAQINEELKYCNNSNFSVSMDNRALHQIVISVSISMFSWGESMRVFLTSLEENKTQVFISSDSNLGTEFAGKSKNRKNIDELVQGMTFYLNLQKNNQ